MNLPTLPTSSAALAQLRLARTAGIGMATYKRLLARCGTSENAIAHWDDLFKGKRQLADEKLITTELTALQNVGGAMLLWGAANYPPALAELPDAPLVISLLGNAEILARRQVAVVGNRSASAHGLGWTQKLCEQLSPHAAITSGLARGIDTAAHLGALAAVNSLGTIAVVAGGLDHIYPPENAPLRQRMLDSGLGCIVSEQPLGSAPTAQLFPRRNRIIAGLSVGVVVAECSKKSGSLITAEHALAYGRDVWAVPGTPGDIRASGPNFLLKQGAQLIEDASDILSSLPARPAPYVAPAVPVIRDLFSHAPEAENLSASLEEKTPRQQLWSLLGSVGVGFDDLLRRTALAPTDLQSHLTDLELDGLATRDPLGNWQRN